MEQSRTKRAATNIIFNFVNQIINLILMFVSRTVFIHVLGVEYLGINGLFSDVLGLLSMADLGFNTAMVYSFYKPLANHDYEKMAALTNFYKKIYTVIAVLVAFFGVLLIPVLPYIVNTETITPHLNLYYLLSLANVVASYLFVYKTSILTADQKNYVFVRITIAVNVVKTILQVCILLICKSYVAYLTIGVVCNILNNLIASRIAVKNYSFIEKKAELAEDEKKNVFQNLGSVFLYKVSSVLLNATDNLLISIIVGTIAVGYYSNYLIIQNKISMFYSLIFSSLTASIGNLIVKEGASKRYEVFKCEQSISFIISGIIVPCYTCLINDFIYLWLGKEYQFPMIVVYAVAFNMYLGCVLQPLWSYREATGLYQKTKWIMLICAILNLVLSVVLGYCLGIAGIIFASAIARLLTYIWYEPKILFKEYFQKNVFIFYVQIILNLVLVIALLMFGFFIVNCFEIQTWLGWFLKAIVVGIVCFLVTVLLYRKSEGVHILLTRIKHKRN